MIVYFPSHSLSPGTALEHIACLPLFVYSAPTFSCPFVLVQQRSAVWQLL